MLFLIAVDVLQCMVSQVNGTLELPISAKLASPILAFQYADDTAIIAHADVSTLITLKLVLRLFSTASGLQINFDKSSFCPINLSQAETVMVNAVMRCAQTQFPISYLGVPLTIRKLCKTEFIPLLEKIETRIEGWVGKLLSKGGKIQLINSVLCSVPIYFMTCFELPKWVVKRIQVLCRNFLWGSSCAKGIPLIGWEVVCMSKCFGGLGIANLEMRNKSLLLRWWWKVSTQPDSLWGSVMQQIRKNKPHQSYPKIWLMAGSFFWNQLIKLHPLFQWSTTWVIGNGEKISYWYDSWGTAPLRRFKDRMARPPQQHISLNKALLEDSEILSYNTGTVPTLYDQEDELIWRWSGNGDYSAASLYKVLTTAGKIRWGFRGIWKAAAPLKIKVFSFLLLKDRILTRDMLRRRSMNCELNCVLCDDDAVETSFHLFFQCANAKMVWAQFEGLLQPMNTVGDTWEASQVRYSGSKRQRKVWMARFMAVLWSIWRQRNELIFQSSRLHYRIVANRAEEDSKLWQKFCTPCSVSGNYRVLRVANIITN